MARPNLKKTNVSTAVTRFNALRHGLTSSAPVIPGVESAEEWQAHLEAILSDRAPDGALETKLVERAASLIWRLRRVERYECESIALGRERVDADFARQQQQVPFNDRASSVAEAEQRAENARRCLGIIEGLLHMPAALPLASADVEAILEELAEHAGHDCGDVDEFMEGIAQPAPAERWTAGALHAAFKAIAARDGQAFEEALTETVARAAVIVSGSQLEVARIADAIDQLRRERLLPDAATLDRIIRYETALNRMLYQALSQLEAMQSRRAGAPTPLHRVQAYGLPGG